MTSANGDRISKQVMRYEIVKPGFAQSRKNSILGGSDQESIVLFHPMKISCLALHRLLTCTEAHKMCCLYIYIYRCIRRHTFCRSQIGRSLNFCNKNDNTRSSTSAGIPRVFGN
jgi:hypothetical protein